MNEDFIILGIDYFDDNFHKWDKQNGGNAPRRPAKIREKVYVSQKKLIIRTQRHHNISFKKLRRNSK